MKTSELTGAALDWAVAKCEGVDGLFEAYEVGRHHYSTYWAQGGPIIEREKISVGYQPSAPYESQWYTTNRQGAFGISDAPLIAAMRCYVASKMGDDVDVPKELL